MTQTDHSLGDVCFGQPKSCQPRVDIDNLGRHRAGMATNRTGHEETFRRLKDVRAKALEHYVLAQQFHAEQRELIRDLIKEGFSQAEIARELGVTRQAIQKMLT